MSTINHKKYKIIGIIIHLIMQTFAVIVAIFAGASIGKMIIFVLGTAGLAVATNTLLYGSIKLTRNIYKSGWASYRLFGMWIGIFFGVVFGLGYLFINFSDLDLAVSFFIAIMTFPVVAQWEHKNNEAWEDYNKYKKNAPIKDEYEDRLYGK